VIRFSIIEIEDGLTIVELQPGQTPEDAAVVHGGVLIDGGPYATYEDATDALRNLEAEDDEERF
jgi:hypothetical protein